MTAHTHREVVKGCYRCELGQDEAAAAELEERIAEQHADRAAGIAEELARNLRARKDPKFGDRVIEEALEVSLPALERHLRAADI
jgi:hypothetical protein